MTLPTYERNKVSKQGSLTAEMEKSSQELRGCEDSPTAFSPNAQLCHPIYFDPEKLML